jgi:hypothetical protein
MGRSWEKTARSEGYARLQAARLARGALPVRIVGRDGRSPALDRPEQARADLAPLERGDAALQLLRGEPAIRFLERGGEVLRQVGDPPVRPGLLHGELVLAVRVEGGDPGDRHQRDDDGGDRAGRRRIPTAPAGGALEPRDRPGRGRAVAEPALEIVGEGVGRRVPPRRVPLHRLLADGRQVDRQVGADRAGRGRLLPGHLRHHGMWRAVEGLAARDQLVEHHAQAILVGMRADGLRLAPRLLGSHVGGRAQQRALGRHRRVLVQPLRQAEVEDPRPAPLVQHDVLRLDVAVDHPLSVRVGQGPRQLADPAGRPPEVAGALLLLDHLGQRPPRNELRGDVVVLAGAAALEDGDDVRVVEVGRRLALAEEPLDERPLVGGELGDLQCDRAVEDRVVGEVDGAEAALTQRPFQLEAAEPADRRPGAGADRRRLAPIA